MAILNVPYFQQETDDTCAPACLRMALTFRFPSKPISEDELAKRCHCMAGVGCRVEEVHRTARRCLFTAIWLNNTRIEAEVEAALHAGWPVLANVQLRVLPYYPSAQPSQAWHSVLIVGTDDQFVYLHDPDPYHGGAQQKVERSVFFADWTYRPYNAYSL